MTASGRGKRGFTLLEALVAVLLLGITAAAVSRVCVQSQRARRLSESHMRATLLAAQGLEQLRAGSLAGGVPAMDDFVLSVTEHGWNGRTDLKHAEVTVTWNDGPKHTLRLHTLARR